MRFLRRSISLSAQHRRRRAMPWEAFATVANASTPDRRWWRLGYILGPAGSRRGHWHSKTGTVHAHNLRIGAPRTRHALTLILQSRRPRR